MISIINLRHCFNSEMDFHLSELPGCGDSDTQFLFHPHQNDFYQLILYTKGQGKHQLDFNTFSYRPFMLVPAAKGQVQVLDGSPGTSAYILSFAEHFLYRHENDMHWLHHLSIFDLSRKNTAIILEEADFRNLITLIKHIKFEYESTDSTLKQDIIRDLLRVFINSSERLAGYDKQHSRDSDYDYELFCNFRKALDISYKSCRTVKEYAVKICITPKKLNQISLKYGGKNSKKMIEERLIMEIKRLLLYTSLNIKEIAMDTGFSDLTNFTKFFKRHTQTTPAKFHLSV